MKKEIAFFDFDGTITTRDTLLEFIKFVKGSFYFYWGFIINAPWLLAFKLGIITNQHAKEKILKFFFSKMPVSVFNEHCEQFATKIIPGLIRPGAQKELDTLSQVGVTVVIVSASPENWIKPWSNKIRAELIGTLLEIENQKITGKIKGKNCYGEEKVNRINDSYLLNGYSTIYAFGDSKGDLPMLALANHVVYKPFR